MTPKQRREQDILKRKTSDINKKYPQRAEPLSEFQAAFKKLKEQDPTSTVREGEFANLENSEGAADDVRSTYNNFLEGAAQGAVGEAVGRKKGGMTKKKMGGGMMNEYKKGGMVRGQGIAIKGTKFKGIF